MKKRTKTKQSCRINQALNNLFPARKKGLEQRKLVQSPRQLFKFASVWKQSLIKKDKRKKGLPQFVNCRWNSSLHFEPLKNHPLIVAPQLEVKSKKYKTIVIQQKKSPRIKKRIRQPKNFLDTLQNLNKKELSLYMIKQLNLTSKQNYLKDIKKQQHIMAKFRNTSIADASSQFRKISNNLPFIDISLSCQLTDL